MLQRAVFGLSLITAISLFALYLCHIKLREKDLLSYRALQEVPSFSKKQPISPITQIRKNSQKDLWHAGKDGKTHLHIESSRSEATLQCSNNKMDGTETVHDISGWTQEETVQPDNHRREFFAEKGEFHLPSRHITVDGLNLFAEEGYVDISRAILTNNSKTILCLSPQGYIEKEKATFEADTARLSIEHSKPQTILLEGAVRIFSPINHRYALANTAYISLNDQTTILDSTPPNRVLFQQDDLKVSASRIQIHRQEIQGLGDVRFFFEPKETKQIEALFSELAKFGPKK